MRPLIEQHIKGKQVLLLFIITNIVYGIMLLITIPHVMGFAADMKLMDMLPTGYDFNYVSTLLATLGEEGREAYLFRQIPVDMVYPGLFAISYCLLLAYFLKKINLLNGSLFYLCLLPVLAGGFDYLENIGIIILLTSFPDLSESSVAIASFFTLAKSGLTTVFFVVLLLTILVWGINAIKHKNKA